MRTLTLKNASVSITGAGLASGDIVADVSFTPQVDIKLLDYLGGTWLTAPPRLGLLQVAWILGASGAPYAPPAAGSTPTPVSITVTDNGGDTPLAIPTDGNCYPYTGELQTIRIENNVPMLQQVLGFVVIIDDDGETGDYYAA